MTRPIRPPAPARPPTRFDQHDREFHSHILRQNDGDQTAATSTPCPASYTRPRLVCIPCTPGTGVIADGVQVPCTRLGVSRSSVYQMTAPIDKVRGEGNCGRVTDRGEEGLLSLKTLWAKLASFVEPPGEDPHAAVVWGGSSARGPYPISCMTLSSFLVGPVRDPSTFSSRRFRGGSRLRSLT